MRWRIISLLICFGLAYIFLVSNLYGLQIDKSDYYKKLAQTQNGSSGILDAPRGNIYFTDKNNNSIPAVLNKDYEIIYAVPTEIQKNSSSSEINVISGELAVILNKEKAEIEKLLNKKNDLYELLIQKTTNDQVKEVNSLGVKGIYITDKTLRYYPFDNLASHVLGFISPANDKESAKYGNVDIGRYGIELYFNDELAGISGEYKENVMIEPIKGQDINLTIDRNIQAQAEEILRKVVEDYKGVAGNVIVEDPNTGKILAMANYPDFNPNSYSTFKLQNFLNPAVQSLYEPGSVFKLITMSAGIDSGKITPDTTYVDTGSFTANGMTITNWDYTTHGAYGKVTMSNVIEHSINTGAVFAERKTGSLIFSNYVNKFGFGEATGIVLPGEVKGNLKNLIKGKEIDYATASYGQGVSVTPLELINAVSAIANGGVLMKPYIIADQKPEVIRRVISSDTASLVTDMMVSAVKINKVAAIPDYQVAGKTGTAFIPNFVKGGYTDQVINTYVGFAPASNPKFVVLVKLEKPEGSPLAGQTVVPSFRELTSFILNYLNVAPDNLAN